MAGSGPSRGEAVGGGPNQRKRTGAPLGGMPGLTTHYFVVSVTIGGLIVQDALLPGLDERKVKSEVNAD